MKSILCGLALAGGVLASAQASAGEWLQWQSNSLTYLWGKDFAVDPETQQTFTFEHADSWKYGDNFLFVDSIHYQGKKSASAGNSTLYGEFSPRLSASKLFGQPFAYGPVSDVLLAMTYEFGEGDVESYLIGPGFDLKVPGFDYFQLNFYKRYTDGPRAGDNVWQITPVFSYTVPVGKSDVLIDGYIDWVIGNDANDHGDYHANLHVNPQIKYDLGKALSLGEKQLYVGIEYDYWKDKYGIKDTPYFDTNQNTASLLVKVFF